MTMPSHTNHTIWQMAVAQAMSSGHDEGADFEFGLDPFLEGLQRLLD